MSFEIYKPDKIESMFFRTFHIKPYIFDHSYSLIEMIGQCLVKINENIDEVNDLGEAMILFEKYIILEINKLDEKLITETTKIIDQLIRDGTIAKLMEYEQGSGILTIQPNQFIYNIGESINSVLLNVELTKGTDTIKEIKLYKNDSVIFTKSDELTTSEMIIDANIVDNDVKYYVTIDDGKTIVKSNTININFVNNFYYGLIQNDLLNETVIKSFETLKTTRSNLTKLFTPNNQKIVFAYPVEYGELQSIYDTEMYDIIDGFTKTLIILNFDNVKTLYNVYTSNNFIFDNSVILKFEF